jgi:hypothetical protein
MTLRYGGRQPHLAPRARLTAAPDEILTRRPMLQAVDQMDSGWQAERGPKILGYHDRAPLPVKRQLAAGQRDFTGVRVGRFTVVGPVDERASGRGARWLVRCDCGIHETRRTRSLAGRMRTDRAMCQTCDYVVHLRRQAYFDRHGRWPADDYGHDGLPFDLAAKAATLPVNTSPPPDPNDKGNRGKGDRGAQRCRAKARLRAQQRLGR